MILNPAPCNMLKRFFKIYFLTTLKSLKTTRFEFDFQTFSGGVLSYFGAIPYPPPPHRTRASDVVILYTNVTLREALQ